MEDVMEVEKSSHDLAGVRKIKHLKHLNGGTTFLFVVAAIRLSDGKVFACRMSDEAENRLKGALVLPAFRIETDLNAPYLMAEFMWDYFGIEFFPTKPVGHLHRERSNDPDEGGVFDIHHCFWAGKVEIDNPPKQPRNDYDSGRWYDPMHLKALIHGKLEPINVGIEGVQFSHSGLLVSAERHPLKVLRDIEIEAKDYLINVT